MRYFLFFVLLSFLATSCKPPLPVYFDKPIGIKVQGFDTAIAGNYIPLNDMLEKGEKEFFGRYVVRYDKIVLKDTAVTAESSIKDFNYEDVKKILGIQNDPRQMEIKGGSNCDSIFHSFCALNELISSKLGSGVDKKGSTRPIAGMVKIAFDRIFFISIDSAGKNYIDTLLSLNTSVVLTRFSGKHFLNFKTQYGWEIIQMGMWENKFLSVRPFYFTSYDNCSKNVSELTESIRNIYPSLKPILNSEKKVIGFKAQLDAKILLEKFTKSEQAVLLLKIK